MGATRLTPTLWVVGALLALQTLAGCTSRACTLIGASSSGVGVTTQGLPRSAPLVVEVCVGRTCTTATSTGDSTARILVGNAAITSDGPTDLTVAIRSMDGKVVMPVTHVVTHPRKYQPNGPDCEPTVYVADVSAGSSGVVEVSPPG